MKKKSILVTFYSRTGTTKKVAERIADTLGCEIEEILDTKNRGGILGFLASGREASSKLLTKLKPIKKDPSSYDLVVIGTPIWAGRLSSPIRTYLSENKGKFKKVAFFYTQGGKTSDAFEEMKRICCKKPISVLPIHASEFSDSSFMDKVEQFASDVMKGI